MKHACRSISAVLALTLLMVGRADAQAAAPAAPAPSGASAHADALFSEGKAKLAAEDYTEACRLFAGSFAIDPATGTLLALALCHERAGDLKAAVSEYRDAAERAQLEGRADRAEAATKRADELEAKLNPAPVPPPPIAREKPKPKPTPTPLPVYTAQEYEQPTGGGLSTWQWVGIVTAGAGVVALGVSAGFAIQANGLNDDSMKGCDGDSCTAEGRQTRLDAVSAGNMASAFVLAGAVLVTTGAAVFFSSRPEPTDDYALAPWVSPDGVGAAAQGRF